MPSTLATPGKGSPAEKRSCTTSPPDLDCSANRCRASSSASTRPGALGHGEVHGVKVLTCKMPAVFGTLFAAGDFDEDAPHGLGRGGEEVPPAVPVLCLLEIHNPYVSFM